MAMKSSLNNVSVIDDKARHRVAVKNKFAQAVLFADLPVALREAMLQAGSVHTYGRDETIFWKGDPCAQLYLLLDGLVKMVHTVETGKEFIDFMVPPGHSLDQLAVIDASPFHFTAYAKSASDILAISRDRAMGLMERFPSLYQKLVSDLASSHRTLSHRMFDLSATSVELRIAQTIFTLIEELNIPVGSSTHVNLDFSRQEMAELVGSSAETVSRVMGRWRKDQIVTLAPRGMTVDLVKLARL